MKVGCCTNTVERVEEKMFEEVTSRTDLEIFNSIWKESFTKENYELGECEGPATRYLVKNAEGETNGTVEIIPYSMDKEKSTVEDMFLFSSLDITKKTSLQHIYEIDKLSVGKYKKTGTLENILDVLLYFAKQHNVHYYYALINPLLFRALKITYGFPVKKAGKLIKTDDYIIQPMFIDMQKTLLTPTWKEKKISQT